MKEILKWIISILLIPGAILLVGVMIFVSYWINELTERGFHALDDVNPTICVGSMAILLVVVIRLSGIPDKIIKFISKLKREKKK